MWELKSLIGQIQGMPQLCSRFLATYGEGTNELQVGCNRATALGPIFDCLGQEWGVPGKGPAGLIGESCKSSRGGVASLLGPLESPMLGRAEWQDAGDRRRWGSERLCGWHVHSMKLSWHLPIPPLSARAQNQECQLHSRGHLCRIFRSGRGIPGPWQRLGDCSGAANRVTTPGITSLIGSSSSHTPSHRGQVYVRIRDGSNVGRHCST